MSKEYNIINGPSKFDLMLALFEEKPVEFGTEEGQVVSVKVLRVEVLDHDGHDAWKFKGYVREEDGTCRSRHCCSGLFSSKDRKGRLSNHGPKNEKSEPAYLDRLSDAELQKELVLSQRVAAGFKQGLEKYLSKLNPHDRLVAEVIAAKELSQVSLTIELEHTLVVNARHHNRAVVVGS